MSVKYTLPADAPQEKLDEVNSKITSKQGALTGSEYWSYGLSNSCLYKSAGLAVLQIKSSGLDSAVPAGTFTKIGTVSFKPLYDVVIVFFNDADIMFQIAIRTNGDIEAYNYANAAKKLGAAQIIMYPTNS